jgi:hypothetical protein
LALDEIRRMVFAVWIIATFLLGIGNFAMHKAVLESRHPMVVAMLDRGRSRMGRMTLLAEFVALLVALLLIANGHPLWGWVYLGYSLFNGISGWLILTRRI